MPDPSDANAHLLAEFAMTMHRTHSDSDEVRQFLADHPDEEFQALAETSQNLYRMINPTNQERQMSTGSNYDAGEPAPVDAATDRPDLRGSQPRVTASGRTSYDTGRTASGQPATKKWWEYLMFWK